ncbi:hypothetical protein BOX15_Mlig027067g1, partial [Macrostomum lignano]
LSMPYPDEQILRCEWADCQHLVRCFPGKRWEDQRLEFSKHCERHAVEAVRVLAVEFGGISAAAELQCQWRNCDARLEICEQELQQNPNRLLELAACHVTQHAHHVIVKQLGRKLIASKGWPECLLNSAFCNSLADQSPEPAPLRCQWDSCEYFTCNTCAFYLHCSNHRFEYERPPPQQKFRQYRQREHRGIRDMPCLWRGCDHVCRSISNLTEHIRCHSKEKPTACPTCGQKFFNNSKLQNHLLRQETPNPVHKCDQCHKLFSSQRILSDHMRRHVNTQKCPHCEFTLPTPSALRRHLQMRHSEERPFVCTEPGCGHSCKTEDQLKVHSRRHDRSLRCDICDQHFVTTHFLYRHLSKAHGFDQLSQSAERVYACHLCHLVTKDSRCLSRHLMRRHHLSRPAGFSKFRFEPGTDGVCRLVQTRLESIEVTKEVLGNELVEHQLSLQRQQQQLQQEQQQEEQQEQQVRKQRQQQQRQHHLQRHPWDCKDAAAHLQLPLVLGPHEDDFRLERQQEQEMLLLEEPGYQQQQLQAAEDEFLPLLSVVTPKAGPSDEQCLSLDIGGL